MSGYAAARLEKPQFFGLTVWQRGGEGNVHKDMSQTTHVGLADKLKNKILGKK